MFLRGIKLNSAGLQSGCKEFLQPSTYDFVYRMSSKSHGASVSPGTILCVLCLLLYSAGFIRIELKSTNHEERLLAVEEVISHITKRGMVDTSTKGKYCANIFLRS